MSFASVNEKIGRHRWTICALIFAATTINYLDRNVLGLLKPVLSAAGVFGADKADQELNYSTVVICFQIAYALGMLLAGKFIDKVGTKSGYAYSLVGLEHRRHRSRLRPPHLELRILAGRARRHRGRQLPGRKQSRRRMVPQKGTRVRHRPLQFGRQCRRHRRSAHGALHRPRLGLGMGFHPDRRGRPDLARLLVCPVCVARREAPERKAFAQAEYDYIHSDADEQEAEKADAAKAKVSWFKLLTFRQTWAFFVGKFLTDPIWWFFLFWLPSFLAGENARKVDAFMAANPGYTGDPSGIPGVISWPFAVAVIYTVSTFGSIFGGWLPKKFINGGMDANKARKLAMFIFALFPLTVLLASRLGAINTWLAVATIAIACAAHQAWSANIFTTVSDMFPKKAVASVTGIGGMAGAVGGILIARAAGLLLEHYHRAGQGRSRLRHPVRGLRLGLHHGVGASCISWCRSLRRSSCKRPAGVQPLPFNTSLAPGRSRWTKTSSPSNRLEPGGHPESKSPLKRQLQRALTFKLDQTV